MKAYTVTIYAKPSKFLLGGVKQTTSSPFETRDMAENWLYAASDQPNYSHSEIKEVQAPTQLVIPLSACL